MVRADLALKRFATLTRWRDKAHTPSLIRAAHKFLCYWTGALPSINMNYCCLKSIHLQDLNGTIQQQYKQKKKSLACKPDTRCGCIRHFKLEECIQIILPVYDFRGITT